MALLIPGILVLIVLAVVVLVMIMRGAGKSNSVVDYRGMMASYQQSMSTDEDEEHLREQARTVEEIKRRTGTSKGKHRQDDLNTRLFKAGVYSAVARQRFNTTRIVLPIVLAPLFFGTLLGATGNFMFAVAVGLLGVFIGFAGPLSWVDRRIRLRQEDIMYFLPLVIEQVSIGVSSSLDIGPCIQQIVDMADERDSHNPVTEMFVHVQKLIRSGLNLEDSLFEVGEATGMTEVKHAFMFLAQCAKHGGEVSKQLQELADATTVQRQVQVEGRIASLPVKATGPLTMVFAGFFLILLAGLFVRMVDAFKDQ